MRFELEWELDGTEITAEYRRVLAGMLQTALWEVEDRALDQMRTVPGAYRPYTFSVWLPGPRFSAQAVVLSQPQMKLLFSMAEITDPMRVHRALQQFCGQMLQLGQSHATLRAVRHLPAPAPHSGEMIIRLRSPLLLRVQEGGRERYVYGGQEGFGEALYNHVRAQAAQAGFTAQAMQGFAVHQSPTGVLKRVQVLHHRKRLTGTLGECRLCGDPALLAHLYLAGMGSRRTSGFGLFDVARHRHRP